MKTHAGAHRTLPATAIVLALLTSLLASMWLVAPAANAYPECQAEFRVNSTNVRPGQRIVLTATCEFELVWRATFNGEVREGRGKTFREVFVAPNPPGRTSAAARTSASARTTVYRLDVVGHFADPSLGDAECRRSFDIKVNERGSAAAGPTADNDGVLPNTGGPKLALLGLGLLLLALGVLGVRRSRRGREA